jgi:VWFA-related protein
MDTTKHAAPLRYPTITLVCAALWLCGLLATAAGAQAPAGPIPPKADSQVQQPPPKSGIRVNVALVNTPVVVEDAKGELNLDLTKKNFHVYDNGVEQRIVNFDLGGEPVSAVIVMETSSRIEALLPAIRRTGILFTETVLGADGDAAVLGYNDQTDQLQNFTADHDAIEKTFTTLKEGGTGAKLYDAMSLAVSMLRNRPDTRRRVIITMAEAVDTGSEQYLGEVLREAQLANITIYSVGLSSTAASARGPQKSGAPSPATPPGTVGLPAPPGQPQSPTGESQIGSGDLMALAEWAVQHTKAVVRARPLEVATVATGGLYQSPVKDSAIETAIDRVGGELHASYLISYRPTTDPSGYHRIKVTVDKPGLKVRSRPGYYLDAPQG